MVSSQGQPLPNPNLTQRQSHLRQSGRVSKRGRWSPSPDFGINEDNNLPKRSCGLCGSSFPVTVYSCANLDPISLGRGRTVRNHRRAQVEDQRRTWLSRQTSDAPHTPLQLRVPFIFHLSEAAFGLNQYHRSQARNLRDHWTIGSIRKDGGTLCLAVTDRDTDEFIVYPEDVIRASSARKAGDSSSCNPAPGPAPAFAGAISAIVPPVAPSPPSPHSRNSLIPAQVPAANSGHPDQAFKFRVRRTNPSTSVTNSADPTYFTSTFLCHQDSRARSEDQPVYGAPQPSDSTEPLPPYTHTATASGSDLPGKPPQVRRTSLHILSDNADVPFCSSTFQRLR
jgi:hypothetical protein